MSTAVHLEWAYKIWIRYFGATRDDRADDLVLGPVEEHGFDSDLLVQQRRLEASIWMRDRHVIVKRRTELCFIGKRAECRQPSRWLSYLPHSLLIKSFHVSAPLVRGIIPRSERIRIGAM